MTEFTGDLHAALAMTPEGEGAVQAPVQEGWGQGRGTFGGLVMALLERAMEQVEPPGDRALRSLSGEILAPVQAGPARIEVEVLRRGSGMTSLAARLRQAGELRAHASALFAKTRLEDREATYVEPPAMVPWGEASPLEIPPEFAPPFMRAFEVRPTGSLPFSGSTDPVVEGWVRLRRSPSVVSPAELIACIDAYWPLAFALEEGPRPTATVAFTYQRCAEPGTIPATEPLFYRARGRTSHQGFATEVRELWTASGTLVAINPQTFAIIR